MTSGDGASLEAAMAQHREQVDRVLAAGDPTAVKRLYVDLGDLLESAAGPDLGDVPVLSLPETGPIVAGLLDGVDGRFLDAGCGPNPALAVRLGVERPTRRIVAVDIGLGTVRLARAVAGQQGVAVQAVVADLEALPFRDGSFDGGVCDDTIEHLPDDRRGVSELARVLGRSGRMVLATPNRHSAEVLWRRARDLTRGRRRHRSAYYAATSHLREYTWRQFERLVEPAFVVRSRGVVGWPGSGRRRLATRLVTRRPFRRLSRMVVLAVEPRP